MKKSRKLLILILVLGVLTGGYAYVKGHPKEDKSSSSKTVELIKIDSIKIDKMKLDSKDGSLAFDKKDGNWLITSNPSLKGDQNAIESIASSFSSLNATRVVDENPGDLESYGLKEPAVIASAVLDDSSEKVVYIGNKTPHGDAYYAMVKGDSKLYTISSLDGGRFCYGIEDVRDHSIAVLNTEELNYVKIVKNSADVIELSKGTNSFEDRPSNEGSLWALGKPYSVPYPVDENKIQTLLNGVTELKIDKFVDDNGAGLSQYGLDKPVLEIMAKDNSAILHIYFGKDMDDGHIYFRIDGSNGVFAMEKDKISAYKDANSFDMVSKNVFIPSVDNVKKIIIKNGEANHIITIDTGDSTGENGETQTVYQVDGKKVDEEAFTDFYSSLIGLDFDSENNRQINDTAEVKLVFTLKDGKETVIDYSTYNEEFYGIFKGEKADFLVSKDKVNKVLDGLKELGQ